MAVEPSEARRARTAVVTSDDLLAGCVIDTPVSNARVVVCHNTIHDTDDTSLANERRLNAA